MTAPNCGEIRAFLTNLATGAASAPAPGVWDTLSAHGAVQGTAAAPQITAVGRHVLGELQIRAYRTDGLPLEKFAGDLSRILEEFDAVARTAEYFLEDLGPVVPPIALPLVRPVALGLANRRETREELAEEFRNVWGGVEVLGGDPRDRLLAAELINATSADMAQLYSPIMNTTERIREKVGGSRPSVTPAAILQIAAGSATPAPLEGYLSVRAQAGSEEAAAMLAAGDPDPAPAVARRDGFVRALQGDAPPSSDVLHAATFLAATHAAPEVADRVLALAALVGGRLGQPVTSAALLATHAGLSPEEIANWHEKATAVLQSRALAPTDRELAALGVALVHGLPESEYLTPAPAGSRPAPAPVSLPALTALHAWIYRPLVGAVGNAPHPAATPPA